jgi:hypothetical protein
MVSDVQSNFEVGYCTNIGFVGAANASESILIPARIADVENIIFIVLIELEIGKNI